MPFGLKYADATYQRCIQLILRPQLGRNIEPYVDDVVVKSQIETDLVTIIQETFDNLWKYCMKLNLEKCTFGVPSGKQLRFLISHRGIEANPNKIRAID